MHSILISFDMNSTGIKMRISQCSNQTVSPVEIISGNLFCGIFQVFRSSGYIRIKWHEGIKYVRPFSNPFHRHDFVRHIWTQLCQCYKIGSVDTNGTILISFTVRPMFSIRIIRSSLIMCRKYIFYIFYSNQFFWHHAPRQGIRFRIKSGSFAFQMRIQCSQHKPGAAGVISMIRIIMAAKSGPGIKMLFIGQGIPFLMRGQIQMIFRNKFHQIS